MATFQIILPNYNRYSVTFDRNLFLALFPDSVISSVLTSTDSSEIEIQESSVTPDVLNLIFALVNEQPIPTVAEGDLLAPSRYLGIPALSRMHDWSASSSSPNFLPLFGLFNALLANSDVDPFLEQLTGEELNNEDLSIIQAIVTEAMQRRHPEVVQKFLSYRPIQTYDLLEQAVTNNYPDIVRYLLDIQDLNPYGPGVFVDRIPKVLVTAIQHGYAEIVDLLMPWASVGHQLEKVVQTWIHSPEPHPELLEVLRPYMTDPDQAPGYMQNIINWIDEIRRGHPVLNGLGYDPDYPEETEWVPPMTQFLTSFAPNKDDVQRIWEIVRSNRSPYNDL